MAVITVSLADAQYGALPFSWLNVNMPPKYALQNDVENIQANVISAWKDYIILQNE